MHICGKAQGMATAQLASCKMPELPLPKRRGLPVRTSGQVYQMLRSESTIILWTASLYELRAYSALSIPQDSDEISGY